MDEPHEILSSVFDKLNRPSAEFRQQRRQDQIGRLALVAEAAADIGCEKTNLRDGEAERMGQDRHRLPRPLIVAPKSQVLARVIIAGGAAEGLQWGRGVAMDEKSLAQNVSGPAEDAVDIAIGKTVVPEDVGPQRLKEQ